MTDSRTVGEVIKDAAIYTLREYFMPIRMMRDLTAKLHRRLWSLPDAALLQPTDRDDNADDEERLLLLLRAKRNSWLRSILLSFLYLFLCVLIIYTSERHAPQLRRLSPAQVCLLIGLCICMIYFDRQSRIRATINRSLSRGRAWQSWNNKRSHAHKNRL